MLYTLSEARSLPTLRVSLCAERCTKGRMQLSVVQEDAMASFRIRNHPDSVAIARACQQLRVSSCVRDHSILAT